MNVVPATHRAKKLAIGFGAGAPRCVDLMLTRQNLNDSKTCRRDVPSGAIGCLGGGALPTPGNICFFTGSPIRGPAVEELTDADAAARLFPAYDGTFTGIFWDAQQKVLVVATDCLGMQPLYMRQTGDGLTLASETKALAGTPDPAAWGAFLSVGHPIGERSLVEGLRRVPPASILTYDCARHRLDIQRYWNWPEPSESWRNYDFLDALEQDIRAYAASGEPGTLLLSGGFDSRLLLFLLQRADVSADALIVAHEDEHGDADGRLAEAVARLAGIPCRKVHPQPDFFPLQPIWTTSTPAMPAIPAWTCSSPRWLSKSTVAPCGTGLHRDSCSCRCINPRVGSMPTCTRRYAEPTVRFGVRQR